MASPHPASRQARVGILSALFAVACWQLLDSNAAFCGQAGTAGAKRVQRMPRQGWRLDMMEVGPSGIGQLVVHEGYYIPETTMFEILNKQGKRYRMRPSPDDIAKGGEGVPKPFAIGPLKARFGEIFGGSVCDETVIPRPEGYRGCAGCAAWDKDLPTKGGYSLPGR